MEKFNLIPGIIGLAIGLATANIGVGIALAVVFGLFLFPKQKNN